ncbi:MAG: NADH-quinone oxidoreductase subunit C [Rickettsiales bacterium]|nr:NADH-quinone oxidoreductase subunit C [Rickettsiales bacterium]
MSQHLVKQVFLNHKKYIQQIFPTTLGYLINKELFLLIPSNKIEKFLHFLKNHTHTQYKSLSDISGTDYPFKKTRFEVSYNLLSVTYNVRVNILSVSDELVSVNSITPVYKCSNWFERESWDMLGVFFYGNKDLRRILTDYGFKGHPLRKDFPVTGYIEVRYDELQKRIITEKVSFAQDFRDFVANKNWLE